MKSKKWIPFCFISATYICLLIAFLLVTIVGLDRAYEMVMNSKSSVVFKLGLWQGLLQGGNEGTNFKLATIGIIAIIFLGVAFVSLTISCFINKKQFQLLYVIIVFVLIVGSTITIITSKPTIENDVLKLGWLFKQEPRTTSGILYSTGGYVMVGVVSTVGVSYVLLGCLQAKSFFKLKK